MKGLKTTVALAVVLAALGGYIYFIDSKKPTEDVEVKDKPFSVDADAIEELQVTAHGETTRLQKTDAGWRVVEPVKADGDTSELSSITSSLSSLEIQRVVEEKPGSLAEYGLEPARITVSFRAKGDKELRRLLIGDKTPSGGDLYAKDAGASRVFLIASFLDTTFNRTSFDLRNKTILKYDREKADSIEINAGSEVLAQFVKKGSDWTLARPIRARAELSAVEGILGSLSGTQVQKFIGTESRVVNQYGFDAPALTVTVGSGDTHTSLLISGKGIEGTRYAKDSSRPDVFTVGESFVKDMQKDVAELRKKDLFEARPFSANRMEVRRGSTTLVFTKTKDKNEQEVWQVDGKTMDASKAEDPVLKLTALRAETFEAAHPSLKSPELTVILTLDDKTTETVTFARASGSVYASRSDEPGTATLTAPAYEDAIKALDEIK